MIDGIIVGLVIVSAAFGFFRGIVSQVMALAGLASAYFVSPTWGKPLGGWVQHQMGCSRFMADKLSIFFVGVAIYIAFRLLGFGIERLLVKRIAGAGSFNRWGGAFLGSVKAGALIALALFFITLVPRSVVRRWAPRMLGSFSYQLAARYNPMGEQAMLERMRQMRNVAREPEQLKKFREKNQFEEFTHALDDKRFAKSLESGDYEALQKSDEVEKLMKDEKLVLLLDQIEKSQK